MKVHFTIIHEIDKPENSDKAKAILSEQTLNSNSDAVINLITELNQRYYKRGGKHSVFDDADPDTFDLEFRKYAKQITNEEAFIEFTRTSTSVLAKEIEKIATAKGGFLVFSYYEHHGSHVAVFIVRDKTGIKFEKGGKRFNLKDSVHVDFEKMAMACRINIKLFKSKDGNYLNFIQTLGDDLSKYFIRWINASELNTDKEDTRKLLNIIKTAAVPKGEDGKKQDEEDFHSDVHRYITNSPGKIIDLRDLGTRFYQDEDFFFDYMEENEISISPEFRANTSELKKLTRISANADNIALSFPHSLFTDDTVRLNDDETQIIITSANLVQKIKENI